MLLRQIELMSIPAKEHGFPFQLPFVKAFSTLEFTSPITFLVGENGSGKSTFLETIACASGSVTIGSQSVLHDPTLENVRALAKYARLTWSKRTKKGFFMRAEDFFGFAKYIAQVKAEMSADLRDVDHEYKSRSGMAKALASLPYRNELAALEQAYGGGLDENSHGEGFFKLFRARFNGEGLYLIDEPEAALSPNRQLTLLVMLRMMMKQGAQFIIATHSPILMAYPNATILSFDGGNIQPVDYETLEHVVVTRNFLENPQRFLDVLFDDE